MLVGVSPVWAATFTVNSTADLRDANVGDGLCLTSASTCTLRAAVQEANSSMAADTIQLPAGTYAITIAPTGNNDETSGDFDITRSVHIVGAGRVATFVDGGTPGGGAPPEQVGLDRLFEIHPEALNVTFNGLTVREGYDAESGGAVYNASDGSVKFIDSSIVDSYAGVAGGGIQNAAFGSMQLVNTIVQGNSTGGEGGGIRNDEESELTLTDSTIAQNHAGGEGGGVSSVSYAKLTITRGAVTGNTAHGSAGGVLSDSKRALGIDSVTFSGNIAGFEGVPGEGGGGALFAGGEGTVTIAGSSFVANSAAAEGGGIIIEASGSVAVVDTVIRDNVAGTSAGGVLNSGMGVTFTRLTITGNRAGGDGGGIESQGSGNFNILDTTVSGNRAENGGGFANVADSTLRISGSVFWDNQARIAGGGVFNESDGGAVIENTTISSNTAGSSGGGLFSDADAGLRVVNVTITRNTSPYGSGVGSEIGGSVNFPITPSTGVILRNTIVAGNQLGAECSFAIGSEGGNLDSGDSCYFRGPRDRSFAAPGMDAIADNGGPTMTHALQDLSFAVDGGVAPCPTVDQRGVTRPKSTACDMGAYEHEGPFAAPDLVDPETSITSAPAFASEERASFVFAGTDNITPANELLYECRILSNDPTEPPEPPDPTEPIDPEFLFVGCPNPYEMLGLELGENTIEVRAIDRAGNVDETPATHTFIVGADVTPPDTQFVRTPANPSAGRTVVFGFTATDDLTPLQFIEFECRIDSNEPEAWLECASPWSFSNLSTGQHTVQVRAVDEGDNFDPTPATYTWTVAAPVDCDQANVTVTASADSWVSQLDADENFGIATQLAVESSLDENARTFITFPLPNDASGCVLESATLRLNAGGDAGRTIQVNRVASSWLESQITWNNQPGVTGAAVTGASGDGWREFDVTALVNAGAANGFVLRDAAENDALGAGQGYASSEALAEPPIVPQLVLRYLPAGTPPPSPPPAAVPATVTCGQVITTSILVQNDLTDCAWDGLVVGAPNIRIDLNGHTIDGPGYFPPVELPELGGPAGIRNLGFSNVIISNGTVQDYVFGVHLMAGTTYNEVHSLNVLRHAMSGIELSDADDGRNGNEIHSSTFTGNELGISLVNGSENTTVRNNVFLSNLGLALYLWEGGGHTIRNNEVSGVMTDPLLSSDGGIEIEGSTDNVLLENHVHDTGDGAIIVMDGSHRNRFEGNVLYRVGDAGISVSDSDGSVIIGNIAHLASDAGVTLSGANNSEVRTNDLRFNPGGVEIDSSSDNVIQGNVAYFGGDGISVGGDSYRNLITGNTTNDNGGNGISVEVTAVDLEGVPTGDGNIIISNTSHGNGGDGISAVGGGNTITANAANNNSAWGIGADEFDIDGGSNTANGNAELPQCEHVVCTAGLPTPIVELDLVEPDTELLSTPNNPASGAEAAQFTFTGSDNIAPVTALRYECRLDAPPAPPGSPPSEEGWEDCASPTVYQFLITGLHRFEVRAVDPFDNVDSTPATFEWTVAAIPPGPDAVPPSTTLFRHPDAVAMTNTAIFGFRGSDNATPGPNLRYECRLDGGSWGPCLSPATYPALSMGAHTFEVRAVDLANNADPTPATWTWTIVPAPTDTIPPDTEIDSAPPGTTVQTTATFVFSSTEPGSTFQCSLDGSAFAVCTSPVSYTGLGVTEHEFRVRATDAAGNTDPAPAVHTWIIGPPPVPATVSCGQTLTQSTLLLNSLNNCGGNGLVVGAASITIDLNGQTIDGTGLAAGVVNNGFDSVTIVNGAISDFDYGVQLNPGTASNYVTDLVLSMNQEAGVWLNNADQGANGNSVALNTFMDNSGIGIMLSEGTQGASIIDNIIDGGSGDGIYVVNSSGNRVEGNLIGGVSEAGLRLEGATNNQVTGNTLEGIADGAFIIELGSHDNRIDGNEIYDAEAGIIVSESDRNQIVGNKANGMSDAGIALEYVNDSLISGNDVRGNGTGIEMYAAIGNEFRANDASESSSTGIAVGDQSLDNHIVLNIVNGNSEGISVEAEVLPGSPDPGNRIDRNTASDNDGDGISVNKTGHIITANVADNNMGWGIYAEIGNTDGGGNRASGNVELPQCYNVVCDGSGTTPPELAPPDTQIVDMPPNPSNSTMASFIFTGVDDNTPLADLEFECRIDTELEAAYEACENPQTYANLGAGTHYFDVRAVDLAGNADPTPARYVWTVSLLPPGVPPNTTIDSGPPSETPSLDALFTFSANEPDVVFECSLDGAAFAECVSAVEFTDLTLGVHDFRVRAIDLEGNIDPTPASFAWTITGPPVITIDAGPGEETDQSTATFAFSANEAVQRFECSLDLEPFATCTTPLTFTGLAIGEHIFRVIGVDLDGHISGDEEMGIYEWTVTNELDTTPPVTTINSGPDPNTTSTSASFTFTSSEVGSTFVCSLDNAAFTACGTPQSYSGLSVGAHNFRVAAVDPSGNTDPTPSLYTWAVTALPSCAAPGNVTVGASADSWVLQSSASSNYGQDSVLKLDSKSGNNARVLVRFNLPAIPVGCQVVDAQLRMYASSYKPGRTLQAFALGGSWTENQVRWNNQPATTGTAATVASGNSSGYRQWAVLTHVSSMYSGANHGFLIRDSVEGGSGIEQGFHSREKGTDNPPRLVITFG
jgi:CSLREA domain-containing protein